MELFETVRSALEMNNVEFEEIPQRPQCSLFRVTTRNGFKYSVIFDGNYNNMTCLNAYIFGGGTLVDQIPKIGKFLTEQGLFGCRVLVDDDGDLKFELERPVKGLLDFLEMIKIFESGFLSLTSVDGPIPVDWS